MSTDPTVVVAAVGGIVALLTAVISAAVAVRTTRHNATAKAVEAAETASATKTSAAIEAYDELITHFRGIVTDQQAQIDKLVQELHEAREALRGAEDLINVTVTENKDLRKALDRARGLLTGPDRVGYDPEGS